VPVLDTQAGSVVAWSRPSASSRRARWNHGGAIETFGASQLYVSLGDIAPDKAVVVRIYWKPLVTFIWLGSLVMALGGILSLSDRRLRVELVQLVVEVPGVFCRDGLKPLPGLLNELFVL
jgi:cytochrome c biogenesis factor